MVLFLFPSSERRYIFVPLCVCGVSVGQFVCLCTAEQYRNANNNKKLSYRRETARQLPTWGKGARHSSPLPPPPPLATPMRMVESETRNKRSLCQACRALSAL